MKIQYLPNATETGDEGSLLAYNVSMKMYFTTERHFTPVMETMRQLFNDSRFEFYYHQTGHNIPTTGIKVHAENEAHLANTISEAEMLVVPKNPKEVDVAYGFKYEFKTGWSFVSVLDLSNNAQQSYLQLMKQRGIEEKKGGAGCIITIKGYLQLRGVFFYQKHFSSSE